MFTAYSTPLITIYVSVWHDYCSVCTVCMSVTSLNLKSLKIMEDLSFVEILMAAVIAFQNLYLLAKRLFSKNK